MLNVNDKVSSSGRREFLRSLSAAALVGFAPRASAGFPMPRLDRVGIQLYTLRSIMPQDFDGTLARVAEIGYREVEFAGYHGRTPEQVRAVLDRVGLTAPSAHVSNPVLGPAWDKTIEAAVTIGHRYLIVPSLSAAQRASADSYRAVAENFNRAAERAKQAGILFGYHNHDREFTAVDGRIGYDILVEETDPNLVTLQMDLFWIIRGGQDPLRYFERYPGRFHSVHVKDMDASPERRMVDVGKGSIDFRKILGQHERAGIRHYFVEHDSPESPLDSARVSFAYLKQLEV
jgi:sugar phosphate isomerase/epimerase